MDFQIDLHERLSIIGKTGSGKTEWVKYMLRLVEKKFPVIIIDPKQHWLGDSPIWESNGTWLRKSKEPGTIDKPHLVREYDPKWNVQVFQPDEEEGEEELNKFCLDILAFRNRLVYFDETESICTANHVPRGIRMLWKTGRAKSIGAWVATQTPTGVPKIFKSQADKFVTFRVGAEDADIAALIGYANKQDVASLQDFEYLWYDTKDHEQMIAEWNAPLPWDGKKAG